MRWKWMTRKISLDRSIRAAGGCRPFPDREKYGRKGAAALWDGF